MHRLLSTVLVLAWGLWFGAIVMVFVTVTSLFATFAEQRATAGAAAAGVFRRFDVLQLVAGTLALLASIGLRSRARTRRPVALPVTVILAALVALASALLVTPRIDALRRAGEPSSSEQFRRLHGTSSALYTTQAVLLLTGGLLLPGYLKRTDTSATTAPA
jgi:hypothetical protein